METTITSIRAYDKDYIGYVEHKRDIMITYTTDNPEGGVDIIDLFLTQVQAKILANDLTIMIKCNEAKIMKEKYIVVEGNHPTLKYVNFRTDRLNKLSLKIDELLTNDYEIIIKLQSKQINKRES